jgi:hypothetical protein
MDLYLGPILDLNISFDDPFPNYVPIDHFDEGIEPFGNRVNQLVNVRWRYHRAIADAGANGVDDFVFVSGISDLVAHLPRLSGPSPAHDLLQAVIVDVPWIREAGHVDTFGTPFISLNNHSPEEVITATVVRQPLNQSAQFSIHQSG